MDQVEGVHVTEYPTKRYGTLFHNKSFLKNKTPNVFYAKEKNENVVALTFDDWGSDKTVMEILAIYKNMELNQLFS